jgi:transposase
MAKPLVSDGLWKRIEPLLPKVQRRYRYPGRKRVPDRAALTGVLFVLKTGIPWEHLPQEMGCGSGMTCWRRLRDWNEAGVWERLHQVLLDELQDAEQLDWSRVAVDSSHVRAKGGAQRPAPPPGQRQAAKYSRHAASDAKRSWNSMIDRGKSGRPIGAPYSHHLTEPDRH